MCPKSLFTRAALLSGLAALFATAGPLRADGDPVANAQKLLLRIEMALESAETQFAMSHGNVNDYKWKDRMEDLREATDPTYRRRPSAVALSGKLSMISHQYRALAKISQLVELKLRVASVLPLADQLQMVNEELDKARARQARVRGAATSAQVMRLMAVQSNLRLRMRQRP